MMKKTISLLLALVLCMSLCACGGGGDAGIETTEKSYEEVRAALVGEWGMLYFDDSAAATVYEFRENGTGNWFRYDLYSTNKKIKDVHSWAMTYEITDSQIICHWTSVSGDAKQTIFDYTFENGTLRIVINNLREYHKDNWFDDIIEALRASGEAGLMEEHKAYIDYE